MSKLIRIDLLDPSPRFRGNDEDNVQGLVEDIRQYGIHTPLHVFPNGERYELVTGHDRLEAARRLGMTEVPCDVRSMLTDDEQRASYFYRDNTRRKSVNKRAIAKDAWLQHPQSTVQQIAECAGVSLDTAYNARNDAMTEKPELFATEKLTGADGKERPRQYQPRTEKPMPQRTDELRKREQQRETESPPTLKSTIKASKSEMEWAARYLAGQLACHARDRIKFIVGMWASGSDTVQNTAATLLLDEAPELTRDECIAHYRERTEASAIGV